MNMTKNVMLNFLKSYQFDKKDTIFFLVQSKIGTKNIALLKKIVECKEHLEIIKKCYILEV